MDHHKLYFIISASNSRRWPKKNYRRHTRV